LALGSRLELWSIDALDSGINSNLSSTPFIWDGCGMQKKQTSLRMPIGKNSLILDPHKMEDILSMKINLQLYRGLFRFMPDGAIEKDIAEDWEFSADKKSISITIGDHTFSDKTQISALNIKESFARLFYLDSSMSSDLAYISGAKEFKKTGNINDLKIEVVDSHKIIFHLTHPSFLLLSHLATADCAILPIKFFKEELPSNIFSGPYQLKSKTTTCITIEKWREDKFESINCPTTIDLIPVDEKDIEIMALEGRIDTIDDWFVNKDTFSSLVKKGWSRFLPTVFFEISVLLNPNVLGNKWREYLYSVIEPETILSKIDLPNAEVAFGLIPNSLPGHLDRRDLPENNTPKLSDVDVIKFDLTYSSENRILKKTAELLAEAWQSKGVLVSLKPETTKVFLENIMSGKNEAIVSGKGIDFKSDSKSNYFFLNDKTVDDLVEKVVSTESAAERHEEYKQIQLKILSHHTIIPLFFGSNQSGLWNEKIKHVPDHPMGLHMLAFEMIELI
jgi:ABC-type transport system substrate-binding protein